ncbi:polysaccharide deacetylase family protein [Shimia sediminis]|uniref:polysaccharide deacetylase family protein n=1 Tax=Shimia sediminis TaxID=2497945 RepID=UPI000F8E63D7|nr:polysaccharide deacetylase [Shimia sediminis]
MYQHPIKWSGQKQCAASITFDIDADSLVRLACPDDADRRLSSVSMGRYGPTVAVPRILETYTRLGLKQTFFMPGWVMENYPDTVDDILAGGHEIGHHSWAHEDPLKHSDAQEVELFEKTLDVHVKMTGQKPRGYRAPVYSITPQIVRLLIKHDFLYDSSMMADDLPYQVNTSEGNFIEIPPHWGTDDWPPFAQLAELDYTMPVRSPSSGLANFFEEFNAAYATGGFWMPVLHPFLTGRIARWRLFEQRLEEIVDQGDVWIAKMEDIASYAAKHGSSIRQETISLPAT